MWDLSCPDWEDRIREGRPLIPDLPLNVAEADIALAMFDELKLPDVPENPTMRDACGEWFRELVRVVFGSWDPSIKKRAIRDFFALVPKGQSKTTYSAGLLLVGMLMNKRPNAEALFVGPTQAISDTAFEKAEGMIDQSTELKRRFHVHGHKKTIEDLSNGSNLRVKTFDVNILTGTILFMCMVDELHLLGRNSHTKKVLRQIRGGLEKTPEGFLLFTTTQSDEQPTGAFKSELKQARKIRDGKMRGRNIRTMLPILYEFPEDIATDPDQWKDPENWSMVMPNMGRSVHLDSLVSDWNTAVEAGDEDIRIWASQHLNIEIGVGISDDGWLGAQYWPAGAEKTLTLEELIERSEVATVGIDGGGMDDLLGLCVIGREKETRRWLVWCHAFAHRKVLDVRKEIAAALLDFEKEGSLTFFNLLADMVDALAKFVKKVFDAGLLPEKDAIGFDPNNISAIMEALLKNEILGEMFRRLMQGTALAPAINMLPWKLEDGTLRHGGTALMNWCVGNAKVEMRGNSPMVTKQASGRAKIDPLIALFCAAIVMSWDPKPKIVRSVYEERGLLSM